MFSIALICPWMDEFDCIINITRRDGFYSVSFIGFLMCFCRTSRAEVQNATEKRFNRPLLQKTLFSQFFAVACLTGLERSRYATLTAVQPSSNGLTQYATRLSLSTFCLRHSYVTHGIALLILVHFAPRSVVFIARFGS